MSTPADSPAVEGGSTADQPANEPPPKPPSAFNLFKDDEAFKGEVLGIAHDIAAAHLRQVQKEAMEATRTHYVANLKASVVKEHFGSVKELAALLPDLDDPAAMNEAAKKLKMRLVTLQPPNPLNHMPHRQRPSATELINYGLEIRRRMNRPANPFGG